VDASPGDEQIHPTSFDGPTIQHLCIVQFFPG